MAPLALNFSLVDFATKFLIYRSNVTIFFNKNKSPPIGVAKRNAGSSISNKHKQSAGHQVKPFEPPTTATYTYILCTKQTVSCLLLTYYTEFSAQPNLECDLTLKFGNRETPVEDLCVPFETVTTSSIDTSWSRGVASGRMGRLPFLNQPLDPRPLPFISLYSALRIVYVCPVTVCAISMQISSNYFSCNATIKSDGMLRLRHQEGLGGQLCIQIQEPLSSA